MLPNYKNFLYLDIKDGPYKSLMHQIKEKNRMAVYDLETMEMEWFVIPPNTQNFATGKLWVLNKVEYLQANNSKLFHF